MEDVANSEFLSIFNADDDAASGATTNRRVWLITWGATLAPVDKEAASATHLWGFLRIKIESAWLGNGRIMHGVFAVAELIFCSRQRPSVDYTLLCGIHVSLVLPWISMSINLICTSSTNEVTSILVISVGHCWTRVKSLATFGQAGRDRLKLCHERIWFCLSSQSCWKEYWWC